MIMGCLSSEKHYKVFMLNKCFDIMHSHSILTDYSGKQIVWNGEASLLPITTGFLVTCVWQLCIGTVHPDSSKVQDRHQNTDNQEVNGQHVPSAMCLHCSTFLSTFTKTSKIDDICTHNLSIARNGNAFWIIYNSIHLHKNVEGIPPKMG